jgi:hypothetical protein
LPFRNVAIGLWADPSQWTLRPALHGMIAEEGKSFTGAGKKSFFYHSR